jgi:hypothetical protein
MAEMFQDREGNTSSKRIIGFWVTAFGVGALMSIMVDSLIWPGDYKTALEAAKVIFGGGLALLGIGVVEFLGKGK